jgi:hypothetical protein
MGRREVAGGGGSRGVAWGRCDAASWAVEETRARAAGGGGSRGGAWGRCDAASWAVEETRA